MSIQNVYDYNDWLEIAAHYGFDPEDDDFGVDLGGGNSRDWQFIGVRPEEESNV